jgi:hypothetical protein
MGKISLTTDIWSDLLLRPYLAVTAHYLSKDQASGALLLRAALIAFRYVPESHTGKNLADILLSLLHRAGIVTKASIEVYY